MFRRIYNIKHLNNSIKFGIYKPPDFDMSKDYYRVLNVKQSDNLDTIKQAYYALAKKYHPDLNKGNGEQFKMIKEAYEVLSDNGKKQQYDLSRNQREQQNQQDQQYSQDSDQFSKGRGPFRGYNPFHQYNQGTSNSADNEQYTNTSTQDDTNKLNPQSISEELLNFLNSVEKFMNKNKMYNNQQMNSSFNKLEQFMKLVYMGIKIVNRVWNLWIKWNDKRKK